jgi:hypothetical protein
MILQAPTVEEIVDYLKLLGFIIEQHSDITYVSIPISPNYLARLAEIWNGINTVSLYCYGDCTILLDALSKGYIVIKYMEHYYAITDSIS